MPSRTISFNENVHYFEDILGQKKDIEASS